MGGSKGASGKIKNYYGTVAGVICMGPVDHLVALILDGKTIWPTSKGWADDVVNVPAVSYRRTGTTARVQFATPIRLVGGSALHRFVLTGMADGTFDCAAATTSISASAYEVKYNNGHSGTVALTATDQGLLTKVVSYTAGDIVRYAGGIWKAKVDHDGTPDKAPPNATYWDPYYIDRQFNPNPYPFTVEHYGQAYFYWGTSNQTLDAVGEKTLAKIGHPNYRRQAVIVLKNFLFGSERQASPNVEVLVRRSPVQTVVVGASAALKGFQANPLCAALELLTDPVYGAGQADALFDATTCQAVADALAAQDTLTYISPYLDSALQARAFIGQLLAYYDGWLRFNATGVIEAGRFLHNEAPPAFTSDTTIDFNDLTDEIEWDAQGWAGTSNRALVKFQDRARAFKDTARTSPSGFNFHLVGESRKATVDRPWITREDQAFAHAVEWGKIYAQQPITGTLNVRAEKATSIKQGDLFLLTHDVLSLSIVCRCTQKKLPQQGKVALRFERERGIAPLPYRPTPVPISGTALPIAEKIELYQFVQPPPALAGSEDFRLIVLAARQSEITKGLRPWFRLDDPGMFYELGEQTGWCVNGTLAQNYGVPAVGTTAQRGRAGGATVQRGRAAGVATLKVTAHGLTTGQHIQITGVGGTGYNTDDTAITVTDADHFTYASAYPDEGTTGDVGGLTGIATIKVTAHGYLSGLHVQIVGLGGTGYNVSDAIITVTDADHFTFPNADAFEATTADVNGSVVPLDDDDTENLQVTVADFTLQADLDKISDTQSDDAINDNALLVWIFKAGDPTQFEIATMRAIRLDAGVYKLKVRRQRFSTVATAFTAGDIVFIGSRADLVSYQHSKFGDYAENGTAATFRLQAFTAYEDADLTATDLCPDIAFNFTDPYAPVLDWTSLKNDGVDIASFAGTFDPTKGFEFGMQMTDANSDLIEAKLVARLGSVELTLWSANFSPVGTLARSTTFFISTEGIWRVFGVVTDASGRVKEYELRPVGGGATVQLNIQAASSSGTVVSPIASPGGDSYPTPGPNVTLSTATAGATIHYSLVALGSAPGAYTTYSSPIHVPLYGSINKRTLWAYASKASMTDSALVRNDYTWESNL
jgi:hypothetical protein